jgi:predicted RND superfamily exporter protein
VKFLRRFLTDWPAGHPRATLAVALVLTIVSVLLMTRLRAETSVTGLLDESQPAVAAMGRVLDQFVVADELLILATVPENAPQADAETSLLAFAARFEEAATRDSEAMALVKRVRYRPGEQERQFVEKIVVPAGIYYLDDGAFAEMLARLSPDGMRRQLEQNEAALAAPGPAVGTLAKVIARDPLRLYEFLLARMRAGDTLAGGGAGGAFFSPDRRSLLIRVEGARPTKDYGFAGELVRICNRLLGQANRDRLRIDITGGYAIGAHSAAMIRRDSIVGVVSSVVGLAALFGLLYRRPVRLFLLSFGPVAIGVLWGFGLYALFRNTVTPLGAVVGGALGGIGIDYTIHYVIAYFARRADIAHEHPGELAVEAARQTSRLFLSPMFAACLTSIIGFATIALSPVPVLRDFAMIGTLCLLGSWLAATLLLPALMTWRRRGVAVDETPVSLRWPITTTLERWLVARPAHFVAGGLAVVAAAVVCLVVGGVHLESESDLNSLHPQPNPPLAAQRFIAERTQRTAGPVLLYLRADNPTQLVTLSHDVQNRLTQSADAKAAGVVGQVGLASLLPDPVVVERRATLLAERFPPGTITRNFATAIEGSSLAVAGTERYAVFLESFVKPPAVPGVASLVAYPEFGRLLLSRDALAGAPAREAVTIVMFDAPLSTRDRRDAALAAIHGAIGPLNGVTVTGMAQISTDVEATVVRDLPRLLAAALVVITMYLALQFRSLKLALIAMAPTTVSVLVVLAFMSLTGTRLNLVNGIMAPLLLGINVDYGIFAAGAWRSAKHGQELSAHFRPLATALLTCCATTFIGFGSMVPSSVPAVQSLGTLINVGVTACAAATLLLVWPAMVLLRSRASSAGTPKEAGEGDYGMSMNDH